MIPRKHDTFVAGAPVDFTFLPAGGAPDSPGYILDEFRVVFGAMPTTSENLSVRIIQDGIASLLTEWDPSTDFAGTTQGIRFEDGWQLSSGASLSIIYTNTDANNVHVECTVREYEGA
jgi:hypothetical protein